MNESSTFCSRYLRGIETRFTRDEGNDDTIIEDEVIGDFENFKQKVRLLGASSVRAISHEKKRLFHWYILNNADEISEYREKHLRLQHRHAQNSMDLYKRHERTFPEWFRAQRWDHPLSGVMVIGESDASGTGDNNFHDVLDEVLHVQYPLERNVWLLKCQWVFFSATCDPTPRRRAQSRLLELECHVAINGCIPMTIAPGAEKPIFPHDICFSQAIGRLFVLDFNDQAMNRFIEHQMLTTFKEFRVDYHRHFKKYSDPEKARNNPPNALVGRHEDWYFLCDHYMSHAFQEQSSTNKAARQKQPYNHSSWSKSFLQRQYKLAERKGEPVDRVELFRETYNQMLELQSQPTPEGSQPLSEDEICDQVLDRRPDYSKGLCWGLKLKACRTASASSSSTSCSQSTQKDIET
ncbi:CACTA en-spm transposon protein [Cucumis melo var. makuwa]|uniref:CACTA en-spm transposon protein n=1 Tax=Cucumis melo var. makuwa TaxID=1194695 RepID=A0A5A7VEF4_CUCMM|nr:CACTA en-spm transposon protein [Cucumis melo var. makuwa]TYK11323.1 CACTA en-spm transposon protein [Cucumis melo var. makuwa]